MPWVLSKSHATSLHAWLQIPLHPDTLRDGRRLMPRQGPRARALSGIKLATQAKRVEPRKEALMTQDKSVPLPWP